MLWFSNQTQISDSLASLDSADQDNCCGLFLSGSETTVEIVVVLLLVCFEIWNLCLIPIPLHMNYVSVGVCVGCLMVHLYV